MFATLRRRRKNIAQQMRVISIILLVVLAGYVIVSSIIIVRTSKQAVGEISQMATLYTNELDDRFFRISRSIFSTVMENNKADSVFWKNIDQMISSDDSVASDHAAKKLRDHFIRYAWEYGTEYQFFVWLKQRQRFLKLTVSESGYEQKEELEEALLKQIALIEDTSYSVRKKWNIMSSGSEKYICKIGQNQEVYFGCYVNVESILEPFSTVLLEDEGNVWLLDENDQSVGELLKNTEGTEHKKSREGSYYTITKSLQQAPFRIRMRMSGNGKILEVMIGSILLLLIMAAVLMAAGAGILWYLKRYILRPVQRFTDNLQKYDQGNYTLNLTESNLMELEQIDDQFRRMVHQINRLKITLYEQELEKQKIEMDFLKLQIRPHFYLNCLNFTYSMIDFGQYQNAKKMIKITGEYLQYIFRNTNEIVPVCEEIKHCRDYLDILLLRYPDSFEYYFEVHEEVKDAEIFPFLIQVFVENAAKEALVSHGKILISVTVFPEDKGENKFVNLYISDTGKGYPEPVLKRLKHGQPVSIGGDHLGITNCLKRFKHYYKDEGSIDFNNSPLGGALVDIHIPYSRFQIK